MTVLRIPNPQLPWASTRGEDARFQNILLVALAIYVAIALTFTLAKLPPLLHPEPQPMPPQATQVVLQKVQLAKPEQPPAPPKPIEHAAAIKPPPVAKSPTVAPKPIPRDSVEPSKSAAPAKAPGGGGRAGGREAPVELMEQARATAAKSGVLQFRDDLAEMRESVDVAKVTRSNLTRGSDTAEKTERALITGKASGGSGGINTAALSTNTGGIALSGRETTRIDSPRGSGGGSSLGGGRGHGDGVGSGSGTGVGKGSGRQGDLVAGSGGSGGRSDEAIRRMMDQQKGGIFAIYNRALRQDPTLQGKFVFEMVIEPGGSVSDVKLISSELRDSDLIAKILARIRMIDFGAADALRTRVNYSLDFLPNG